MTALALVPEDKSEWLRCRPWIENALVYTRGTHNIEDVEAGIERGKYQFFSAANCAVVVQIIDYPRMKVMNYFLAGGDMNELKNTMHPAVKLWAKRQGCKRIGIIGRPGWLKALFSIGFRYGWTMVFEDL